VRQKRTQSHCQRCRPNGQRHMPSDSCGMTPSCHLTWRHRRRGRGRAQRPPVLQHRGRVGASRSFLYVWKPTSGGSPAGAAGADAGVRGGRRSCSREGEMKLSRSCPAAASSSSPPPPSDTSMSWFMSSLFCSSSALALRQRKHEQSAKCRRLDICTLTAEAAEAAEAAEVQKKCSRSTRVGQRCGCRQQAAGSTDQRRGSEWTAARGMTTHLLVRRMFSAASLSFSSARSRMSAMLPSPPPSTCATMMHRMCDCISRHKFFTAWRQPAWY